MSRFRHNKVRPVWAVHSPRTNFPLWRQRRSPSPSYTAFHFQRSWPGKGQNGTFSQNLQCGASLPAWEECSRPQGQTRCRGINPGQAPGGGPPETGCGNQERWRDTGRLVQEHHQRQREKDKGKRGGSQLVRLPAHFQILEILTRGLF